MEDKRIITPKRLERMMELCLDCSKRNNNKGYDNSKLFIDEICNACYEWTGLRRHRSTPSRAAILRLCRAVRHEARDRGLWFEAETVDALNAVEKQLKRKGN